MYLYSCNTDNSLFIGIMTRHDGDISEWQVTIFYEAARKFFVTATWYGLEHLPLKDSVLENAAFFNLELHEHSAESFSISQLAYFVSRLVTIFHIHIILDNGMWRMQDFYSGKTPIHTGVLL